MAQILGMFIHALTVLFDHAVQPPFRSAQLRAIQSRHRGFGWQDKCADVLAYCWRSAYRIAPREQLSVGSSVLQACWHPSMTNGGKPAVAEPCVAEQEQMIREFAREGPFKLLGMGPAIAPAPYRGTID